MSKQEFRPQWISNFYIVGIYRSSGIFTHCDFCLNLEIIRGDMKETVSGLFLPEQ